MDIFPTIPVPVYPCVIIPKFNTLVSDYENGGEQRRSKWMYPKFDIKLNYYALDLPKTEIIWNFYLTQRGSYRAFYFIDLYAMAHTGLYIATGDGVSTIFDIPGKSTSSQTYYQNGSVVSSGITFLSTGGGGGSDRIQFNTAPALGDILSVDFTGFLRIKCRFKNDNLDRENFMTVLFRYGIDLKGVK